MTRFVHVGFAFAGVPKVRDLEPIMTAVSVDWIRYSTTNWILWTDRPMIEIGSSIRQHIDAQDNFFAAAMHMPDSYGELPHWAWNWINSKGETQFLVGNDAAVKINQMLQLAAPKPPVKTS